MAKMICFSSGIMHVFTCLFLLYLSPNTSVLCDDAKEINSTLSNFCEVPVLSPHMNNTYKCIKNIKNESNSCVSNGRVSESTVIRITCNPGYSVNGENALVSVCYDNEWVPPVKGCISYPRIDCGQLQKNSNESESKGMPWTVAIFQDTTGYMCFGTIISSKVILTSEFCMLTSNFAEYDYKSMSQNPLDPTMFKAGIVNDIDYQNNLTWWSRVKYYASELNPFQKYKHFTPLMIKEFRYFKHGNQDKSLFHDILIVIMEKEIKFNSHVYPICVQWENPTRLNITTGIAKIQQFNLHKEGFSSKDYSFMSHDTCQKHPTYPHLVFNWANLVYGFDKANRDYNDTTSFRRSNPLALQDRKLFCLELMQDKLNDSLTISGSGVFIEKDHHYFIRGIAGERLIRNRSNNDAYFKNFMNKIRNIANITYEDLSKNISNAIINGSFDPGFVDKAVFLYNYNFTNLLQNHLKGVGAEMTNDKENLIGVTDIADYVDWIKHVVAEVDPHYNPST